MIRTITGAMPDEHYCDPACPHLPKNGFCSLDNDICELLNKPLVFYDWWHQRCDISEEEEKTLDTEIFV